MHYNTNNKVSIHPSKRLICVQKLTAAVPGLVFFGTYPIKTSKTLPNSPNNDKKRKQAKSQQVMTTKKRNQTKRKLTNDH